MKESDKLYCDTSRVHIREISKSVAKEMILRYHYSHAWTMCRYALGIFYRGGEVGFIDDEKLIGCAIYGYPVGRNAVQSIIDGLAKDQCLELTRLFIHDGYGSNIESYAVGQSFKWLRENAPNIKMLLSYADPEQMHLGGIYQATNWLYQDCRDLQLMPNYSLSIQKDPYDWIHSRTVFSRWGSVNLDHLKTELGKENIREFWRKRELPKHRYIQVLGKDKIEKRKLLKQLKHKTTPYPKNAADYILPIEHYETFEVKNNKNFW
jgi:hypothetical protein